MSFGGDPMNMRQLAIKKDKWRNRLAVAGSEINAEKADILMNQLLHHLRELKSEKYAVLDQITSSKLALEQLFKYADDPTKLKEWLKFELTASLPIWNPDYQNTPEQQWIRAKFFEGEEIAEVNVAGVQLSDVKTYSFSPNNQVAIWFSLDSNVAIREREMKCVIERGKNNPSGNNSLIYSSAILSELAKEEMKEFAQKNNIKLIDINNLDAKELSPQSRKLLELAVQELSRLGSGGNPAGASDLIRWIPEIMCGKVYADIDLPVTPLKEGLVKRGGLPVLLHMGSMVSYPVDASGMRQEACLINTDIIGFSQDSVARPFMSVVGENLIDAYENPFRVLKEAKESICNTQVFKELEQQKGDLYSLRNAVRDCNKSIEKLYHFLGPDLFKKACGLDDKSMPEVQKKLNLAIQLGEPIHPKELQPFLDVEKVLNSPSIKNLQRDYYKPLVMEISGPGIVFKALNLKRFGGIFRLRDLPTIPIRALELYGCVNNMTNFVSDNIVPWKTTEEQVDSGEIKLNKEGLSWVPNQNKSAGPS